MTNWPLPLPANASAQSLFANLLGLVMLVPLAWIKNESCRSPSAWGWLAARTGIWLHPLPHVFEAFADDASCFRGVQLQRGAAILGGPSAAALSIGWLLLFVEAVPWIGKALST